MLPLSATVPLWQLNSLGGPVLLARIVFRSPMLPAPPPDRATRPTEACADPVVGGRRADDGPGPGRGVDRAPRSGGGQWAEAGAPIPGEVGAEGRVDDLEPELAVDGAAVSALSPPPAPSMPLPPVFPEKVESLTRRLGPPLAIAPPAPPVPPTVRPWGKPPSPAELLMKEDWLTTRLPATSLKIAPPQPPAPPFESAAPLPPVPASLPSKTTRSTVRFPRFRIAPPSSPGPPLPAPGLAPTGAFPPVRVRSRIVTALVSTKMRCRRRPGDRCARSLPRDRQSVVGNLYIAGDEGRVDARGDLNRLARHGVQELGAQLPNGAGVAGVGDQVGRGGRCGAEQRDHRSGRGDAAQQAAPGERALDSLLRRPRGQRNGVEPAQFRFSSSSGRCRTRPLRYQ